MKTWQSSTQYIVRLAKAFRTLSMLLRPQQLQDVLFSDFANQKISNSGRREFDEWKLTQVGKKAHLDFCGRKAGKTV